MKTKPVPGIGTLGFRAILVAATALAALALPTRLPGFSLLGPYEDWMTPVIGYQQPGDIGGPMDIGKGYRWNVPIVTYAFDQSFLDYFGSNGVAAVEAAIEILNGLPKASEVVLTNFPLDSLWHNYSADSQQLFDIKSTALSLLIEQMGLAQPQRYVFALHLWDPVLVNSDTLTWPPGTIPNLIFERNFDPLTHSPTRYVNDVLFGG
jgi:hypothetical protein